MRNTQETVRGKLSEGKYFCVLSVHGQHELPDQLRGINIETAHRRLPSSKRDAIVARARRRTTQANLWWAIGTLMNGPFGFFTATQ